MLSVSEVFQRRRYLEQKFKELEEVESGARHSVSLLQFPAHSTSTLDGKDVNTLHQRRSSMNSKITSQFRHQESDLVGTTAALDSEDPLTDEQVRSLRHVIRDEIQSLNDELSGKGSNTSNCYPYNLNIRNFAAYIPLPSVVYQLQYPRRDHIDWSFVAEKIIATFGVLLVMYVVSQAYIYPVVVACLEITGKGMPIRERLRVFPSTFGELLFPLMLEFLLSWYVIWECIVSLSCRDATLHPSRRKASSIPHCVLLHICVLGFANFADHPLM